MKKLLNYSLLGLALALGASTMAHADKDGQKNHDKDKGDDDWNQAPEIDAGLAISGFTLLGGTLTVLRARRRQ